MLQFAFFILTDNPVNWIMIIKGHKSKSSLFSTITIGYNVNDFNLAKTFKVISYVRLLCVLLNSTNKYLFHRDMGAWPV